MQNANVKGSRPLDKGFALIYYLMHRAHSALCHGAIGAFGPYVKGLLFSFNLVRSTKYLKLNIHVQGQILGRAAQYLLTVKGLCPLTNLGPAALGSK